MLARVRSCLHDASVHNGLIDRTAAESRLRQIRLKTVQGSKGGLTPGHVSEVRQTVLALIELKHRGANIPDALTQRRAAT